MLDGVRLVVTSSRRFRPVLTGIAIVFALQAAMGSRRLWGAPGSRPGFFDLLCGTDAVRLALLDGEAPSVIAARWRGTGARFREQRARHLLYAAGPRA